MPNPYPSHFGSHFLVLYCLFIYLTRSNQTNSKKRKKCIFNLSRFRTESDCEKQRRKKNTKEASSSDDDNAEEMVTFEEFLGLEVTNRKV